MKQIITIDEAFQRTNFIFVLDALEELNSFGIQDENFKRLIVSQIQTPEAAFNFRILFDSWRQNES